MINIKYLVIHCSDTPDDRDVTAEEIHRWHLEKGYSGIGYHYVILRNGVVEKGRPDFWKGAHAKIVNDRSLGICLIGRNKFDQKQFIELKKLIKILLEIHPKAKVRGHFQFEDKKTCPNFDAELWWQEAKND